MNTPNNRRKKESQDKIEKAFLQMIQTKEIEDISISRLCKAAGVNRSTFYANYIDIYDLVEKIRDRMINEFASIFNDKELGHTYENYLTMFRHIKDNRIFYRTYFKLGFDANYDITYFSEALSKSEFNNRFIEYHGEFFKAGISAIIKMWLNRDCKETPEEMVEIIQSEYKGRR
ncbi:MAG: TetR/AcrR family transcriptional regulator [Candidatus Fimenecus sp.]